MESCSLFETHTENENKRSPPLSVLHILAPAIVGGLESVVQMLATSQHAAGHRVHVALVIESPRDKIPWACELQDAGIDVRILELPPRAYLRERREIESLCRSLRPDVVHTHGTRPDVIDAPIARKLGIATVTTVHGFTGGSWKNRVYEWLQYRAFRRFDAVVAVSRHLGDVLAAAGLPRDKIHVVPNAWVRKEPFLERAAARRSLNIPDVGFRIAWVGRLSWEKGPDLFLKAMGQLRDLPLNASIIGDGRQRPSLERLAQKLGIEDRITWHGVVPNAARFLPAFDLLVLSSRTEGTPIVLFEAMDARLPIVATSVGGVPDVLTADNSILVAPENVQTLAGAIKAVSENPDEAHSRVLTAPCRLSAQFALPAWIAEYARIYASVWSNGQGGGKFNGSTPKTNSGG
jgi:glycosyltransferase involved in cell wall biosynthesis